MDRHEARAALEVVEGARKTTQWRPARWAAGAVSLAWGAFAAAAVWERWVLLLVTGVVTVAVLAVLHRLLINPHIRANPAEADQSRPWWVFALFLWVVPVTMLPPEPWFYGALTGIGAGVHAYFAVRTGRLF